MRAWSARARGALTLADHDSQVTQPFPHLTVVVRSSWGCIWAVCSCISVSLGGGGLELGTVTHRSAWHFTDASESTQKDRKEKAHAARRSPCFVEQD